MQYDLYRLNPNHVRELIALGAVKYSYLVTKEKDWWGIEKEVKHDSVIHFWNAEGIEVGMASILGGDHPTIFEKPRVWGDEIKKSQWFHDIRISDFCNPVP